MTIDPAMRGIEYGVVGVGGWSIGEDPGFVGGVLASGAQILRIGESIGLKLTESVRKLQSGYFVISPNEKRPLGEKYSRHLKGDI